MFVSSTYLDLKAERQAAVEAILQAGHIPAGMELFAAGDESQWETIKQWIDESDVYMLLLGERYGSLDPATGKSYTQLEYEYALRSGKRAFALVMNDSWVHHKYTTAGRAASDDHRAEHKAFKELVLTRMSSFVGDENGIKVSVFGSLRSIESDMSLGGWVRTAELVDSQALVVELRKSLEELRERIAESRNVSSASIDAQLDLYVKELRNVPVPAFKDRLGETLRFGDAGNALGLIYMLKDVLRNPRTIQHMAYPFRAYSATIKPKLELWGLYNTGTHSNDLNAAGRRLLERIEAQITDEDMLDVPKVNRG